MGSEKSGFFLSKARWNMSRACPYDLRIEYPATRGASRLGKDADSPCSCNWLALA